MNDKRNDIRINIIMAFIGTISAVVFCCLLRLFWIDESMTLIDWLVNRKEVLMPLSLIVLLFWIFMLMDIKHVKYSKTIYKILTYIIVGIIVATVVILRNKLFIMIQQGIVSRIMDTWELMGLVIYSTIIAIIFGVTIRRKSIFTIFRIILIFLSMFVSFDILNLAILAGFYIVSILFENYEGVRVIRSCKVANSTICVILISTITITFFTILDRLVISDGSLLRVMLDSSNVGFTYNELSQIAKLLGVAGLSGAILAFCVYLRNLSDIKQIREYIKDKGHIVLRVIVGTACVVVFGVTIAVISNVGTDGCEKIVLNEICLDNRHLYIDSEGDVASYIELYNTGALPIAANNLYVSDDVNELSKIAVGDEAIAAGSRYIVKLGDDFLNGDTGNMVYLANDGDLVIDSVSYNRELVATDNAMLRAWDGGTSWSVSMGNPLGANVIYSTIPSKPILSAESGFYDDGFDVTIEATPGARVFYTTDGSMPSMKSEEYTQAITIGGLFGMFDGPVIVKAVSVDANGNARSDVAVGTYFVGQGDKYKSSNVVSLVTDNGEQVGLRLPATLTSFLPEGNVGKIEDIRLSISSSGSSIEDIRELTYKALDNDKEMSITKDFGKAFSKFIIKDIVPGEDSRPATVFINGMLYGNAYLVNADSDEQSANIENDDELCALLFTSDEYRENEEIVKALGDAKSSDERRKTIATKCMDYANMIFSQRALKNKMNEYGAMDEEYMSLMNSRVEGITRSLKEELGLSGSIEELTLNVNNINSGNIMLDGMEPDISKGAWTGKYYTDYPIHITAVSKDGYHFAGWSIKDETGEYIKNEELVSLELESLVPVGGIALVAQFEPNEGVEEIEDTRGTVTEQEDISAESAADNGNTTITQMPQMSPDDPNYDSFVDEMNNLAASILKMLQ